MKKPFFLFFCTFSVLYCFTDSHFLYSNWPFYQVLKWFLFSSLVWALTIPLQRIEQMLDLFPNTLGGLDWLHTWKSFFATDRCVGTECIMIPAHWCVPYGTTALACRTRSLHAGFMCQSGICSEGLCGLLTCPVRGENWPEVTSLGFFCCCYQVTNKLVLLSPLRPRSIFCWMLIVLVNGNELAKCHPDCLSTGKWNICLGGLKGPWWKLEVVFA